MKSVLLGATIATLLAVSPITHATTKYKANPQAVGDIIARDLSIPGLKSKGHVGIYRGSNGTIEVLNQSRPITEISLDTFKRSSPYWGAKYGLPYNGFKAIAFGRDQKSYSPKYTVSPYDRVGRYKTIKIGPFKKKVKITARYRCDTFVYRSALRGGASDGYFKGYNSPTLLRTPEKLYNSIPKHRT